MKHARAEGVAPLGETRRLDDLALLGEERIQLNLIDYVMDLEALVRWFALPFSYEDQEGNFVQNEPIWTVHDERGNYFPENDRLQRTWKRVME
jgi:hypothetical protein